MDKELEQLIGKGEILLHPSDTKLQYSGRIDLEDRDAPVFVYAGSFVKACLKTSSLKAVIRNRRSYFDNAVGVLCGTKALAFPLKNEGITVIDLGVMLLDEVLEVTLYKRQDACHYFEFLGFILPEDAEVLMPEPLPLRKMEFFGDSVTCGEVSEAIAYAGLADPEGHEGRYSNSYYSYSWMTARKLNAMCHLTAQGGISLLDGEGYFAGPSTLGMLSCYDKIEYYPGLGPTKDWDFARYTPQVVVVAIGQNDANPVNYMDEDYDSRQSAAWRVRYAGFLGKLRSLYPKATIITTTTILNHSPAWDRAIREATSEMNDPGMHHFLYKHTGRGTHGHIRITEADLMSDELSAYIRSLGEEIWRE